MRKFYFLLSLVVLLAALSSQCLSSITVKCNAYYEGSYFSPYGGTQLMGKITPTKWPRLMVFVWKNLYGRNGHCVPFCTNSLGYGSQIINLAPDLYEVYVCGGLRCKPIPVSDAPTFGGICCSSGAALTVYRSNDGPVMAGGKLELKDCFVPNCFRGLPPYVKTSTVPRVATFGLLYLDRDGIQGPLPPHQESFLFIDDFNCTGKIKVVIKDFDEVQIVEDESGKAFWGRGQADLNGSCLPIKLGFAWAEVMVNDKGEFLLKVYTMRNGSLIYVAGIWEDETPPWEPGDEVTQWKPIKIKNGGAIIK